MGITSPTAETPVDSSETAKSTSSSARSLAWFAVLAVVPILIAAAVWAVDHPAAAHYDEAIYFRTLLEDQQRLDERGVRGLVGGYFRADAYRPPGYRFFALPTVVLFGVDVVALRMTWIIWFAVVLALVFAAVRRLSRSVVAAALATALVALSPQILSGTVYFGTEIPMYLVTALTLYFLARAADETDAAKVTTITWVGLGLSFALGALTKATYAAIAGPLVLVVLLMRWRGATRRPMLLTLAKAAVLGGVIAAPWWVRNGREAMEFATFSAAYERHSLGSTPSSVWIAYLRSFTQAGLGTLVTAVIVAALIAAVVVLIRRRDRAMGWPIGLALAAVPLVASQLTSQNHGVRLVTPIFILLAAAAAIAADRAGWLRRAAGLVAIAIALVLQLGINVSGASPSSAAARLTRAAPILAHGSKHVLERRELWDLDRVRTLCRERGLSEPSIALLGSEAYLSGEQLRLAWARHGERVRPTGLYRWEQREFSMDAVVDAARQHEVVLTVPGLRGDWRQKRELDNQHNTAFAERLASDPDFGPPVRLKMGRLEPIDLYVFFNRRPKSTTTSAPSRLP